MGGWIRYGEAAWGDGQLWTGRASPCRFWSARHHPPLAWPDPDPSFLLCTRWSGVVSLILLLIVDRRELILWALVVYYGAVSTWSNKHVIWQPGRIMLALYKETFEAPLLLVVFVLLLVCTTGSIDSLWQWEGATNDKQRKLTMLSCQHWHRKIDSSDDKSDEGCDKQIL